MRPTDYFRKIAIVWLRVIALLMLLYGIVAAVYAALMPVPEHGSRWAAAVAYGIAGIVLWALSTPLGRLAAAGLDEPEAPAT